MRDPTLLAESILSPKEKRSFLECFTNSRLRGAKVADILDILDDHDSEIAAIEEFAETRQAAEPSEPRFLRLAVLLSLHVCKNVSMADEFIIRLETAKQVG